MLWECLERKNRKMMDVNDEIDHLARILEKVREIRQICDEAGFAHPNSNNNN